MASVYEIITDRIIRQLEAGTAPWHKPWSTPGQDGLPRNLLSGHPYRGINVWILGSSGKARVWAGLHEAEVVTSQNVISENKLTIAKQGGAGPIKPNQLA
jgi:antirestriction protein ArdC